MRNIKKLGIVGVAVAVTLGMGGCSAEAPEAAPEPTVEPEPEVQEEPATDDANAFGETVRLEFDGAVWDVTIEQPSDAPDRLAEDFPLPEGERYVTVPGTIVRIEGGTVTPIEELSVEAIVDAVFVEDEYLGDDEFVSLNTAPDLTNGGEATFTQSFAIAEGAEVRTVLVSLGMGEAAATAVFGEAVDFGEQSAESGSSGVDSMKYIWDQATPEQQTESLTSWGLDDGTVTDAGVTQLVQESTDNGVILNEAEAREFLEWVLTQ